MITTYSYDAANQLVAEESAAGTITYTYDPNGNRTVRNDGGARTTYTWDAENRLVGVAPPTGGPVTTTYDGDGLRRRLETPTEDTRFVWDDQNVLLDLDASGDTVATYTLAPRPYGELLSQRRDSDSRFYLFDGLGSTDRLLDEDEAVTDSYTYEAFGTARASSGSTLNVYGYVGRLGYQFDQATGLHYIRARHYGSAFARFVSVDPLVTRRGGPWSRTTRFGSGLPAHPWLYAGNDPLGWVDPTGLAATLQGIVDAADAMVGTPCGDRDEDIWCTDVWVQSAIRAGYRVKGAMAADYEAAWGWDPHLQPPPADPLDWNEYNYKCRPVLSTNDPENPFFFRRICNVALWMARGGTWQEPCTDPKPGMFVTTYRGPGVRRFGRHSGVIATVCVKPGGVRKVGQVIACSGYWGNKVVRKWHQQLGFDGHPAGEKGWDIVGCGEPPSQALT